MSNPDTHNPVQEFLDGSISRRDFIRKAVALGISASAIGSVLSACGGFGGSNGGVTSGGQGPQPGGTPQAVPTQSRNLRGKFSFQAAAYTPSRSMKQTPNNPVPHDKLEEVINQYQQMHPNVEIDLVRVPEGTDTRVWTVTQLTGDRAPEVVWTQSFDTNRDAVAGKDWWVPLDKYLQEPNPYIQSGHPGSKHWIDEFYPAPTGAKYAPNGHIYVIPFDLVTTYFFYNKDIFDKVGVQPPKTYAELIDVLSKVKQAGYVAYNGMQWSRPQLAEMICRAWEEQIKPTGPGGSYTIKDVDLAIINGIIDADSPRYRDYLRLMKDSEPYWSRNWTVSNVDWELNFSQGKLAILEDGSWEFGILRANKLLKFDWGTFFMPTVTKGTGKGESQFADGKPAPSIGGATSEQYGVTKIARENNNIDLVIDFLRYMTAPKQADKIIGELGEFLPNEKEANVNSDLRDALQAVAKGVGEAGMIMYADKLTTESSDQITKLTNQYLLGKISLESASKSIQKQYMQQAKQVAAKQGWK